MTDHEIRAKVKHLKFFYKELVNYALINSILVTLWLVFENKTVFWPKYVMLVWGLVLLFKACRHGVAPLIFNRLSFLSPEWEDEKVTEILKKKPSQSKIFLKRLETKFPLRITLK